MMNRIKVGIMDLKTGKDKEIEEGNCEMLKLFNLIVGTQE